MPESQAAGHGLGREAEGPRRARPSATRVVVSLLLRFLAYAVLVQVALGGFLHAVRVYGISDVVGEGQPLERVQLLLLVAASLALMLAARGMARSQRRSASVLRLLALAVWLLICRELDAFFDNLRFVDTWKIPFAVLLLVAVRYGSRHRRDILEQFPRLLASRSFGLFFAAFVWIMVASRLMGQQVVWESALGDSYQREIPRVIEELGELVGYVVLLLGAVEACIESRTVRQGVRDSGALRPEPVPTDPFRGSGMRPSVPVASPRRARQR